MVENIKQENATNVAKSSSYKGVVLAVVLLAICGAGAYAGYKNGAFDNVFKADNKESSMVSVLQNQINELNIRINNLEKAPKAEVSTADLAMLNDKINTALNFNNQILDAKANTSSVLGVINRVDNLETKIASLGKVSSQGALVLTAAMLVKDNAYKGEFTYEAEVLKHLALGTAMEKPAEDISQYAATGVLCNRKLIEKFNELHQNMQVAPEPEKVQEVEESAEPKNWKEKLNSKIKEFVIIEKHQEDVPQTDEEPKEDEVYKLVNDGYFALAIEKMNSVEAYNTEDFKVWEQQVVARENFDRALKQIEALTLAFMKTEGLQNK